MNPLVSILIPVYNRKHLIAGSIKAALDQTYSNIEVVIVDNCSTDGTWEVISNYAELDSRLRIFKNSNNIGPVKNWEKCIAEAKGKYAKLLFSDDLIAENFIEETVQILEANDDVAFVYSKIHLINLESNNHQNFECQNKKIKFKHSVIYLYQKIFGFGNLPNSPGSAIFRTSDLANSLIINVPNKFGLDFSRFGAGNDLLIFLNISLRYNRISYTSKTYSVFQGHKDSFSSSNSLKIYYDLSKLYFAKKNKLKFVELILILYINLRYRKYYNHIV